MRQRDLRSIAEERVSRAVRPRGLAHLHDIAAGGAARRRRRCAIDPRMAAAQPLFAARRDYDERIWSASIRRCRSAFVSETRRRRASDNLRLVCAYRHRRRSRRASRSRNICKQTLRGSATPWTITAPTARRRWTIRRSASPSRRAVADGRAEPRHRARRQRPGRADRRQQGRRHPRRAVQRPLYRPAVARAQRRERPVDGRPHRRIRPGRRDSRAVARTPRSKADATSAGIDQISEAERSAKP